MEYYSVLTRNKMLTYATTWMNLKNLLLSEISQSKKTNTAWFHIYIYNCTLGSEVHVQNIQDCCRGTYMAMWFADSIPPSPISGISPHIILPQPPYSCCPSPIPTQQTPVCGAPFPVSMCSHFSSPTYEWEYAVFHFLFLCQFAEDDVL